MSVCPICEKKQAKRRCPGLSSSRWSESKMDSICSPCCGEHREVGIDCPADCTYLIAAHRYEAERRRKPKEIPFASVSVSQHFLMEQQVLVTGLSLFLVRFAQEHGELRDPDVVEALDALARGYQTLDSGLYYEQEPPSVPGKKVYEMLRKHLEEFAKEHKQHTGTSVRPGDVLRALVFLRRVAEVEGNGRLKSRRYLSFLGSQFPAEVLEAKGPASAAGSGLIVPGR